MNKYNPNIHHRRSIRLKGYDYSQAGLYFITICVQDRRYLFGKISNGKPEHLPEMILNEAGKMIEKWYYKLESKFPDIKCHEMIVMPNHFHCIVENVGAVVKADTQVCPILNPNDIVKADTQVCPILNPNDIVKADTQVCPILNPNDIIKADTQVCPNIIKQNDIEGEHLGSPLQRVVQWFKTMTTNEYIRGVKSLDWQPFNGKLWQRNYYEHIIRNQKSYDNISKYIINNPVKWANDKFHTNKM